MQVTLAPAHERFVKALVKSGRYDSDRDVIEASLRLLRKHERALGDEITDFRDAIDAGLAQARAGRLVDGEEAFARLRRRAADRKKRART